MGEDGEPHLTLFHVWDRTPATDFRELSEAHPVHRPGRFFLRDAPWGVAVPADPALAPQLAEFVEAHPRVLVEEPAQELIDELAAEYERASETVALSYAEDAELRTSPLGGELHPFQRAGVRYALERRRTFIADEQGLGKTVQALATIEADDAFPAVVVCPASMKLVWERETQQAGSRTGAWPCSTGAPTPTWTDETRGPRSSSSTTTSSTGDSTARRAASRARSSSTNRTTWNARAARTKAALELAGRLPEDALRLGLTGTPILNRAEELVSQLRVLGRVRDFGSGRGSHAASAPPGAMIACTGTCARTATCDGRRSRCCRSSPPRARTPCRCCFRTSTSTGSPSVT